MTTPHRPTAADALDTVRKALTFADWAAGEGLHASDKDIPDPAEFLTGAYATGNETREEMIEAVLAKLSADRPTEQTKVRVKPLDWRDGEALSPLGDLYSVGQLNPKCWQVYRNGVAMSDWYTHSTEEKAAVAAQADYEARVLSCISPAPAEASEPTPAKAEPVAYCLSDMIESLNKSSVPWKLVTLYKHSCGGFCHPLYAQPSADLDRLREENESLRRTIKVAADLGHLLGWLEDNEERVIVFLEACGPDLLSRAREILDRDDRTEGGE